MKLCMHYQRSLTVASCVQVSAECAGALLLACVCQLVHAPVYKKVAFGFEGLAE